MHTCLLTLFRMGLFGAAHGRGGVGQKGHPYPKICHTYPTIMKLGTILSCLKKIQKKPPMKHPMSFGDISIFSPEIINFCYIKKYKYRLHFNI